MAYFGEAHRDDRPITGPEALPTQLQQSPHPLLHPPPPNPMAPALLVVMITAINGIQLVMPPALDCTSLSGTELFVTAAQMPSVYFINNHQCEVPQPQSIINKWNCLYLPPDWNKLV